MRAAFRIPIRPDRVADYVAAHAQVWPELLDALTRAGVRNYSIFLDGDCAFGYFESDDLEQSDAAMAAERVNARWQEAMAPLILAGVTGVGGKRLPEIFRLE